MPIIEESSTSPLAFLTRKAENQLPFLLRKPSRKSPSLLQKSSASFEVIYRLQMKLGMGSEHTVFALEQFSLAEDKQLEVTLYERNGGRTQTFYVTAEDLQLAKKIDNLKLKW